MGLRSRPACIPVRTSWTLTPLCAGKPFDGPRTHFKELTYIDGSGFVGIRRSHHRYRGFGARGEQFKFCLEYGRDLKLIFEPGKFLVSEAGAFIAKVNS